MLDLKSCRAWLSDWRGLSRARGNPFSNLLRVLEKSPSSEDGLHASQIAELRLLQKVLAFETGAMEECAFEQRGLEITVLKLRVGQVSVAKRDPG
jgi:hypothetical protein